jgi:hypothetical protein
MPARLIGSVNRVHIGAASESTNPTHTSRLSWYGASLAFFFGVRLDGHSSWFTWQSLLSPRPPAAGAPCYPFPQKSNRPPDR